MEWNEQLTDRFDELRLKQIAGALSAAEQEELFQLIQTIESGEASLLTAYFGHVAAENVRLQTKLQAVQDENEALGQLVIQQEQLVADARRWLAEFDRRNTQIQQSYSHLTGSSSPV
jgi:hypothetical protein